MSNELRFDFLQVPQLKFGFGRIIELPESLEQFKATNCLFVGNRSVLKSAKITEILAEIKENEQVTVGLLEVQGEPDTTQVDKGVQLGKELQANCVIAIGGGSAIDLGKAIAGLLTNEGEAKDYMEVIGTGKKITNEPAPLIAIPTTAGTGSEATKNAVILSKKEKIKASIRSPLLIPKLAIIDPELMLSMPRNVTASTGMDALTQLIEAYTSNKAQPLTDVLARMGLNRAIKSLLLAYDNGQDVSAREDMAFSALLSGICLANAGLGAVHGFAGILGGRLEIPHGVICAALLKPVIEENIRQMVKEVPYHRTLTKYVKLAYLFGVPKNENIKTTAFNLIERLEQLTNLLKIPKLSSLGLQEQDFETIIPLVLKSSSIRYNPVALSEEALYSILQKTL